MNKTGMKNLLLSIDLRVDQPWENSPGDMGGGLFSPVLRDVHSKSIIASLEDPANGAEPLTIILHRHIDERIQKRLLSIMERFQVYAEWPVVIRDAQANILFSLPSKTLSKDEGMHGAYY